MSAVDDTSALAPKLGPGPGPGPESPESPGEPPYAEEAAPKEQSAAPTGWSRQVWAYARAWLVAARAWLVAAWAWLVAARAWLVAAWVVLILGTIPGGLRRAVVVVQAPGWSNVPVNANSTIHVHIAPILIATVRTFSVQAGLLRLAREGVTDAGHATFSKVVPGEYWVLADAPGMARASSHVIVEDNATREIEMTLGAARTLTIHVASDLGEALSGVEIEVRAADPIPTGVFTGADGTVSALVAKGLRLRVTARKAGYEDQTVSVNQEDPNVALILHPLSALLVKVFEVDGKPAAHARVQIASTRLWPPRYAETKDDGSVRIAGLQAESYALRASKGAAVSRIEVGVNVVRGTEQVSELHLLPGVFATVQVVDADDDDDPLTRAQVTLVEEGLSSFPLEGTTGPKGLIALGPVLPGPVTVSAAHEGYVPAAPEPATLPATEPIKVALSHGGALSGTITDSAGHPVGGAVIRIIGTDLQGNPIDEDPRRMAFREAHFAMMEHGPKALINAGELGVVPGPLPAVPHLGSVYTARDSASGSSPVGLLGASVNAAPTTRDWVSGAAGDYHAEPVSAGRLRVLVRHPEFVETLSEAFSLAPRGKATIAVVLRRGGTLEGHVVDASGRAANDVIVTISGEHEGGEHSVQVGTDGSFAFAAVPNRLVASLARASDPMQILFKELVVVPDSEHKHVVFTLPAAREATLVRITDERGSALDNAQVTALSLDPSEPSRQTVFTAKGGEATLSHVRGLPLRIEIRAAHFGPKAQQIDAASAELRIALAPSESLTGEVRSARGDRLESALISVVTETGVLTATTDRDGEYHIDDLAAGAVTVRVRKAGFAPESKKVQIASNAGRRPSEAPRFELREEAIVEGMVVDSRGNPVAGARVAKDVAPVFLASAKTQQGVTLTDSKGRFRLTELPSGTVILEAYAPDLGRAQSESLELSPGRTRRDVRLVLAQNDEPKAADLGAAASVAVTLGETTEPREVVLVHVSEGSEAERAGLLPNDVLVAVDRVKTASITEARRALTGPLGEVVLELRRGDKPLVIRVTREAVHR